MRTVDHVEQISSMADTPPFGNRPEAPNPPSARPRAPETGTPRTIPGRSPGHLLQDLDAAGVVLDQVVVSGEDRANALLDG